MILEVSQERTKELIEKVAVFFASRRLGAPALLFLESMRPLNFIGSQIMYFIAPFANVIFSGNEFEEFAAILSERENIQKLIQRIDELDEQFHREQREREAIKRKKFWKRVAPSNLSIKIKKIFKKDCNVATPADTDDNVSAGDGQGNASEDEEK